MTTLLGAILAVALLLYAVTGGADFGAGVLELFARGPRARQQRDLIAHAIAPIWEANHVWLILIVVLLFVCFPEAFAELCIKLHIPLTVMLVGVVLRGSAFVFRAYGNPDPRAAEGPKAPLFGRVFALSSAITPLALGTSLGAAASAHFATARDFTSAWLAPFPLVVGLQVLCLFVLNGAVYLACETKDPDLRLDFRVRAAVALALTGVTAALALYLARDAAPHLAGAVLGRPALLVSATVCAAALGLVIVAPGFARTFNGRVALARVLVVFDNALFVAGLALAQAPYLLYPDHPLTRSAPPGVLRAVLWALAAGSLLLCPALVYLLWLFKRLPTHAPPEPPPPPEPRP